MGKMGKIEKNGENGRKWEKCEEMTARAAAGEEHRWDKHVLPSENQTGKFSLWKQTY